MTTRKKCVFTILIAVATICFAASILFCNTTNNVNRAYASRSSNGTNTDGEWTGSQTTPNLIPKLTGASIASQGWKVGVDSNSQPDPNGMSMGSYGYVISAQNDGDELGSSDYTGGVYYTITLSEADRVKANAGQLQISATAQFYFQGVSTHKVSIRAEFYNATNAKINGVSDTHSSYNSGFSGKTISRTLNNSKVPAGTCTIQVWFSNWGNLLGRPYIANPSCYLHDTTAPSVAGDILLDKSSIADSANSIAVAGNTIKYSIQFNEKVSITANGTANITFNGNAFASSNSAELITESGKSRVCYTFTLPDKNENGTIAFSSVSGLSVRDEAGNSVNINSSFSSPTLQYYRAMNISSSITHLTFSGGNKATYNSNYTATLSAVRGYNLPDTITVSAGGSALSAGSDYSYDNRNGAITVYGAAIKNDITIQAAGVAKKIAVSFDKQNGMGGVESTTATFDSAMPSVTAPTRTGYTFLGYYTQSGDVQYYDANGRSVKNCDFVDPITLYAHWSANKYTINFNANKPGNASASVQGNTSSVGRVYDDGEQALPQNGFTLHGWTFAGWATRADGNVVYTNKQTVQNLTANNNETFTLYAVWQAHTHTLTLNAMGGTNSGSLSATFDSVLPGIAACPSRHGYNFTGYFDRQTGGEQYYGADGTAFNGKTFTTDDNIVLYAQWTPITYSIDLYSEGNYIKTLYNIEFGKLVLPSAEECALTRKNFDFVGWNVYDEQNWAMYHANTNYTIGLTGEQGQTVVLYASWQEKPVYSLFYDANGGAGAPATTQAHLDESITLSDLRPVRDDYTFVGWAQSGDATDAEYLPGGEFTMGNSVITLFAVWKHNPSLTYDANQGSFLINVATVYPAPDSLVTVTETAPVREGYEFAGWATDKDADSAQYVSGGSFTMPSQNTVLYAVWQLKQFSVSQNTADGYTITGLKDKYSYGEQLTFTVSGTAPKVFINGALVYGNIDGQYTYKVTENITVIVADASSLVLLYSANGGDGAPTDSTIYSQDSQATVSDAVPVRTGYEFVGWSTNKNAQTPDYNGGSNLDFSDEDVVLYAVWRANVYTVTYNADGGDGAMQNSDYSYGSVGVLAQNEFEKQGYAFVGWSLTKGGQCVFADGAEIINLAVEKGENVTLYAVWERLKTLITFDTDGGMGGNSNLTISYGERLADNGFTAPIRRGYTFGGYFTQRQGEGQMLFDEYMQPTNGAENDWNRTEQYLTLYAYWIPTPETIKDTIDTVQDDLADAIEELRASIQANKADIDAKVAALDAAYQAADTFLRADFAAADTVLQAKIDALQIIMQQADNALQQAIEAVQTNLNNAVSNLQSSIDANKADINARVSALDAAYQAADTLLRSDMAAADKDLDDKIAALQKAMQQADNALQQAIDAVQTNLNNAVAELKTSIANNKQDIEDKVAALDAAYKAANTVLRAEFAAADQDLDNKITALQNAMNTATAALQQAIDAVQSNLNNAVSDLQASIDANETDIEDKVAALNKAYQAADTLLRSEMTAADQALDDKIAALKAEMQSMGDTLQAAIDIVQNNLNNAVSDLQASIDANKTDIENKVAALDKAFNAANDLLRSDMVAADQALDDKIAALKAEMQNMGNTLQAAIDIVQNNLNNAAADLQASIDANKADIEDKVAALDKAFNAANDLLRSDMAAADKALDDKIAALKATMQNMVYALQSAIYDVRSRLDDAIADLNASIAENKADIEDKVAALDAAYKAADALINSDIAGLQAQNVALANSIAALDAAYRAADKALWDGIKQVQSKYDAMEQQNQKVGLVYMIINIVLGCIALALITTLVVKAINKKSSQK